MNGVGDADVSIYVGDVVCFWGLLFCRLSFLRKFCVGERRVGECLKYKVET